MGMGMGGNGDRVVGKNVNVNEVLDWEWEWFHKNGTTIVFPAHLYNAEPVRSNLEIIRRYQSVLSA